MFEWRLLTKEEKDKIISEYMKQDEEMDFMEYARRKRDMIFMCEDIEYWERFSKRLKELRISYKKEQEEEKKVREKNIEEIKKRRKMFEKIRQEREMLKYMTEKNRKEVERVQQIAEDREKVEEWKKKAWGVGSNAGNEAYLFTGKELKKLEPIKYNSSGIQDKNGVYEYKNGVLEPVVEKPKTKRVKLSEMSDEQLKAYYIAKQEESRRRARIQEEIKREEIAKIKAKREEEIRKYNEEHPVKKQTDGECARKIVGALTLVALPVWIMTAYCMRLPENLGAYIIGIMTIGGGFMIIPFIPYCFKK